MVNNYLLNLNSYTKKSKAFCLTFQLFIFKNFNKNATNGKLNLKKYTKSGNLYSKKYAKSGKNS